MPTLPGISHQEVFIRGLGRKFVKVNVEPALLAGLYPLLIFEKETQGR